MKPIKGQQKKGKIMRKTSLNNRGLTLKLWDQAPFACNLLNTKGIITSVNQTEARLLGYKNEELVGQPIFNFILPEQQAEAKKEFQQKLANQHPGRASNRIYVRKDGSKV